jgi:hypothetical protein
MVRASRRSPGVWAIVSIALAWGLMMHNMGWAQSAHLAQVRAFAAGQAEIDPWHWETRDKAWVDGHFYSVKAPGLPAVTLPAYLGLEAVGAQALAHDAVRNSRGAGYGPWTSKAGAPYSNFGFSQQRAQHVEQRVQNGAPIVWVLTLLGATLPALLLLLGVRWVADRVEPGYGTAAAVTLGLGTIVMTFASEYFSHVIAAGLGFAAFALLFREREGPERLGLVGAAGLLAGLAVSFEYPLFLVGAILFFYALARHRRLARGAVYASGAIAGAIPALAFNLWALGSPFRFAYGNAVAVQGLTGHAMLGLNDDGLFGISLPRLDSAVDLLLAGRGLLTLTPVLVMALVGVVIMRRGERSAEARVIGAVALVYFVYNAGYWLPFGGGTPGPRFLIPAMPFLAVGLATAYRRLPATTLALAIPSAVFMLLGALTYPLLGDQGTVIWVERLREGVFEHTLLASLGVGDVWLAIAPVLLAVAAAIALAARATPGTRIGDVRPAVAATLGWAAVSMGGPTLAGDPVTPLEGGWNAVWPVAVGAGLSLFTLLLLWVRNRRSERAPAHPGISEPRLGEPIS